MFKKEKFSLKTEIIIQRRIAGTEIVIDEERPHNIVVNGGKERIAKLLNEVESTGFTVLGIGTGTTSELATDTELETEVTKESATCTYEASYKAVLTKTFSFGSGVSHAITEAGAFDGTGSGSTMFNRWTFSAKNVDADTDLYVELKITVS